MIQFGKGVFQFYSAHSFRFDWFSDAFINKNVLVVDKKLKEKKVLLSQKIKNNILYIETANLKIKFKDYKTPKLSVLYKIGHKWKKWKYGQIDKKNLKGADLDMFRYPKFRGRKLTDGVLSPSGYYVYEDRTQTFWDKDFIKQYHQNDYRVVYFIDYGQDFQKGLSEYANIFGVVPMIPKWALGFWYSRYYAYTQKEFLNLLDQYKRNNLPLDVLVVDTDWREKVWHGYDWAKKYFPNPKKFAQELKKRKIKWTLNDHPGYFDSEILPKTDAAYKKIQKRTGVSNDWRCNWKNQTDVNLFLEYLIKPKLKLGVDFWWIDGWGADGFKRNEEAKNRDKMELSPFSKNEANSQLWLNYHYYRITKEIKKKRGLILSRWGGVGSHRYPIWFSGDTISSWKTLKYQIYFTYTGSNLLNHYWSNDIGGFLGQKIDKELFIRWFQFGALSPILRTHSDHGVREPWKFDKETLMIFKNFVHLRYKLVPYFYNLVFLSHKEQKPLNQPLYYQSKHPKAFQFKEEYLLGAFILIAPIVVPSKRKKVKKVFLPEGKWYSVFEKEVYDGPIVCKETVRLDVIPMYVKEDAIIPITNVQSPIKMKDYDFLRFEIFPKNKGESFVYIDDGETDKYLNNKFAFLPINFKVRGNVIEIVVDKPKGDYPIKNKKIEIVIHLYKQIVSSITHKDKKIQFQSEKKILNQFDTPYQSVSFSFMYRKQKNKFYVEVE